MSGGDDCEAKLWDLRQKRSVKTLGEKYQVRAGVRAGVGKAVRGLQGEAPRHALERLYEGLCSSCWGLQHVQLHRPLYPACNHGCKRSAASSEPYPLLGPARRY